MTGIPSASLRIAVAIAVLNPDGSVLDYLTDILPGGTVSVDATAENIRTCSFSCLDPDGILTPLWSTNAGQLNPDGVEVKIYAGYIEDDAVTMYAQGVFRLIEVDAVTSTASPGPVLNITGTDRSIRISQNLFANAYAIANGTPVATAILDILAQQAPWVTTTNIVASTATIAAQQYQPGDDPWQAIQEICASAGLLVYFDREGIFTVIVDPSQNPKTPSAFFIDGAANTATSVTKVTNNSPGYNGVIVTGQSLTNATTVISGSAFDDDPSSPTYYLGAYGKVPAPPVQASTVTTDANAAAMAKALLPQVLGMTHQVVVETVPCFWMDVYDLFRVYNVATQTNKVLIIEQATIPLDYSQLHSLTGVPLGTDISQYDGLSNAPSVAAYAPTSNGAFNYNPSTGTYTYGSGASTGALGTLGLGGWGMFGLGVMYPNQGGVVRRVLRVGNKGYVLRRDSQGIETVAEETL